MEVEQEEIFVLKNDEIEENTEMAELIRNQISSITPIKQFVGTAQRCGHFKYSVYSLDGIDGLIIKAEWCPAFGYSWTEERIIIVRFKE
jgi:hypothetical protein